MTGHLVKRSKGHWSVVLEFGKDEHGKRIQKWYSGYRLEKQARDAMNDMIAEYRNGGFVAPDDLTVGQWLDTWLRDWCNHIKPYTRRGYEDTAEQVKAEIADVPLQKLSPARLQQMANKWHTVGSSANRGPIAANTIKKAFVVISAAMNRAVALDMLRKNPCKAVSLPRVVKPEISVLSLDEVPRMLEACKDSDVYMPVLLALTTGMRRGEIVGLRWQDVDFDKAQLIVRQGAVQVAGKVLFDETKTGRIRVVALSKQTMEALRQHRTHQKELRLQMGNKWQDHGLVCTDEFGQPTKPEWLSYAFMYFARQHGFKVTFHGLRHTHATMLLSQGVNMKVTQERLGHSNMSMTSETYSHLSQAMQQTAVEAMEQVLDASVAIG